MACFRVQKREKEMACFQLDKHMGLYYDDAQRQSQRQRVPTIEQVKSCGHISFLGKFGS